jgi:hypothetical protein
MPSTKVAVSHTPRDGADYGSSRRSPSGVMLRRLQIGRDMPVALAGILRFVRLRSGASLAEAAAACDATDQRRRIRTRCHSCTGADGPPGSMGGAVISPAAVDHCRGVAACRRTATLALLERLFMSEQSAPPQLPPQARLAQMATGFILSRLVYTAASLGIADHLASSPKSARELATPTGCDADSLNRFMRTLTNFASSHSVTVAGSR